MFYIAGQPFYITNSLLTLFLIDILIIVSVLVARRGFGDETKPARGLANFFEMLVEAIYNLAEFDCGRKMGKIIFPMGGDDYYPGSAGKPDPAFPGF